MSLSAAEEPLLEGALQAARDTRYLAVEAGVRHKTAEVFASLFGSVPAVIVADQKTFVAAGREVQESFRIAGHAVGKPFIFGPHVYAETPCVKELQKALEGVEGIPVAVGSGTINDLTKLVAHRLGRPYLAVATAASMDGYTAYGASITHYGSKQTFDCPAPKGVLADLDVIARAPRGMNASGYADLMAKEVAGADWIVAEAAGVEPIEPSVWATVQNRLRAWVDSPSGIARNEPDSLRRLVNGLMMSGFAMQAAQTSRPASGAEHQFSHLWDMQHHTFKGAAPSHGFKVGIGTLASLALYDALLRRDLGRLDVEQAIANWQSPRQVERRIVAVFGPGELADKAKQETRAKTPTVDELRTQLTQLRDGWPELRSKLVRHLSPFQKVREALRDAGCPHEPEQIGIPRDRLRLSYEQAYYIRRRFTVLDFARRAGIMDTAVEHLFSARGPWPISALEKRHDV
ncbi:sn-glycerol-1-phosphate dehydrogenase [Singulisphaera sp. Ch08]|uniref:Sn-glycerol-1-phosphate dehydrogenase n=1 Tax=Singulisphaera sp. Ch08 TaxID=3120278 RepID=A0AAU7CH18_9BACT